MLAISAMAVGCQGEDGFSLTPPGFQVDKPTPAKTGLVEPCSEIPDGDSMVLQVLDAVNEERSRHHLRPLRLNQTLTRIAEFWTCRMIEDHFFGHNDPYDGSAVDSRAVNFGYGFRRIGENLAAGHEDVAEVFAHWMRSPGHRANILDPAFVDLGIAVRRGGEYGVYWVQEFGRPTGSAEEAGRVVRPDSHDAGEASPQSSSRPAAEGA